MYQGWDSKSSGVQFVYWLRQLVVILLADDANAS